MRTQYCQNMRHALHPLHIDSFSTCLTCIYAYHASIDAAHITGIAQIPQQLSYLFVADVPIPHLLSGLFVAPQGPYPAYPDLVPQTSHIGFPNKANLPQTSGIYGSHHRCAFFIASVSAKSNEEDGTAVVRRGDHIGSLHGKSRGWTSAKQQFHNEKRMPFHLAIHIRSMPSATFHRGWRK